MTWISLVVLICNVAGAALMVKHGLPSAVPLLGRSESDDSVASIVGLALFATSIAVRFAAILLIGV